MNPQNGAAERIGKLHHEMSQDPRQEHRTHNHSMAALTPIFETVLGPEPSTLINGVSPENLSKYTNIQDAFAAFAHLNGGVAHLNSAAEIIIAAGISRSKNTRNVRINLYNIASKKDEWELLPGGYAHILTPPDDPNMIPPPHALQYRTQEPDPAPECRQSQSQPAGEPSTTDDPAEDGPTPEAQATTEPSWQREMRTKVNAMSPDMADRHRNPSFMIAVDHQARVRIWQANHQAFHDIDQDGTDPDAKHRNATQFTAATLRPVRDLIALNHNQQQAQDHQIKLRLVSVGMDQLETEFAQAMAQPDTDPQELAHIYEQALDWTDPARPLTEADTQRIAPAYP